ncbi:MAG: alkaline phosphatase family protein [Thermoleophilaceae bacterium]
MTPRPEGVKKVVLAVIDAMSPEGLQTALAEDAVPALGALIRAGTYTEDCVSTFPSVTPVAASAITTGMGPAGHLIPSMNWFHRGEERYVEYGTSFSASRAHGMFHSLQDTVYNMNLAHLSQSERTVFEHLDDAGLRTACTTYLIYRGRHRHEPSRDSAYVRLAEAAQFRHAVWGPKELFYADLFDTQNTGCFSTLGLPGQRDQHSACVGERLVKDDLFDFLLFSLPDNDTYSHREGPDAQPVSLAHADRSLQRLMDAGGGAEAFLEEHAVIVVSDHSHDQVVHATNLSAALAGWRVLAPMDLDPETAQVAVCPGSRSAQLYALGHGDRASVAAQLAGDLEGIDGVDVIARKIDGRASIWTPRGELDFAPGGELEDARGNGWSVDGERAALDLFVRDGVVSSSTYPDALRRMWSALECPRTGDVLLSAEPGYEFTDWGGRDHVGGGSHGSLHRCDSLGVLITCGIAPPARAAGVYPSIEDVTPMVLDHFGAS